MGQPFSPTPRANADASPAGWLGRLLFAAALLAALGSVNPVQAFTGAGRQGNVGTEIRCLALNIYFEARSEPDLGKHAVGHVVMNRVIDPRYPETVCAVIRQGEEGRRHRCQFSWRCDGQSDKPTDTPAWEKSKLIAHYVYWGFSQDPTHGALWYHADYVRPSWRKALLRGPEIGRHIFYLKGDSETRTAAWN